MIDGPTTYVLVHSVLRQTAEEGSTISYSDAMKAISWSYQDAYKRNVFAFVLRAITYAEVGTGNPMLTAVVVQKEPGIPTKAFFDTAGELDRLRKDDTDICFWKRELDRVYNRWRKGVAAKAA
ncbi:MAG TPA: hypothetical protein VNW90_31935 [Acetobacteraceae bacterium]|jgi:hypothetical protein|nr:hypothetical protein [Acetobacteraceae bacterium]